MSHRYSPALAAAALLAAVFTCAPSASAQCAGYCGTINPQANCWCDDACFFYGDCCDDVVDTCFSPTVIAIEPASLPTTGGTLVITGNNFGALGPASTIVLVIEPPQPLAVTSWTAAQITATVPPGVGADQTLHITSDRGGSTVVPAAFDYDPPRIEGASPASGSTAGGYAITLTGRNFGTSALDPATVTLGGQVAPVTSQDHTQIICQAPAGAGKSLPLNVIVTGQAANPWTFTYEPPTITDIDPPNGPTAGGVPLTIHGSNFGTGAQVTVTFDDQPLSPTSVDHDRIEAVLPPGEGADNPIKVTVAGQTSNSAPYTYAAPQVSSISPANAPTAGGTELTINGSNFGRSAAVTIGGNPAPIVGIPADDQIRCLTPPGQGIDQPLQVEVAGQAGTPIPFNYDPPEIIGVDPTTGPPTGGNTITITGRNFGFTPTVLIGGVPAENESLTHTELIVRAPQLAGSNLPVEVLVAQQLSAPFFGYSTALTITDVQPRSGPSSGGTLITITGGVFGANSQVTVGSNSATVVDNPDPATIVAVTPAGSGQNQPVVVADALATSPPFVGFSYESRPIIHEVQPPTGPTAGGLIITIAGENFGAATGATIGGNACENFQPIDQTRVTCTLPAGQGRAQEVVVFGPVEASDPVPFDYDPPTINQLDPPAAPTAGGALLTIRGANFGTAGQVHFGPYQVTPISHMQAELVLRVPAGVGAEVPVQVEVSGQLSPPANFDYFPPQIDSISPANAPTSGGTVITITGENFGTSGRFTFNDTEVSPQSYADNQITFNLPEGQGTGIPIGIEVGGQSITNTWFNYNPPQVTDVTPTRGTRGTAITITGSSFGVTGIPLINEIPMFDVVSYAHNEVVVRVPEFSGLDLPIKVASAGQVSQPGPGFSYLPVINGITPTAGPTAGGSLITIFGENFGAAATATLGGNACPPVGQSADQIICTLPEGQGVERAVEVTSDGTVATAEQRFSYLPPQITGINPSSGTERGGIRLTINGSNFGTAGTAYIGGVAAPATVSHSHTEVVVETPRGDAGQQPVEIAVGGQTVVSPVPFTYLRFGDANGDGQLTAADFALLETCLNGPDVTTDCPIFDDNGDDDVDFRDFAIWQRLFGIN
jgi:hypothetical protein